jgi:hypothetical protein
MKNPAAEQRGSSFEKKKSYGLFSFYTGGLLPRHHWQEIEPPQRDGVLDPPRIKTVTILLAFV